jgi:hypothetical protein
MTFVTLQREGDTVAVILPSETVSRMVVMRERADVLCALSDNASPNK